MMMIPRRRNELDLFDDFFSGDDFFSRRESSIMKTDIKEKKDKYIIEMDLPGYDKENISLELKEGYLQVSATMEKEEGNEDEHEKYVHKERFYGHCSRNFYVGDEITQEDVQAEFKELPDGYHGGCQDRPGSCGHSLFERRLRPSHPPVPPIPFSRRNRRPAARRCRDALSGTGAGTGGPGYGQGAVC